MGCLDFQACDHEDIQNGVQISAGINDYRTSQRRLRNEIFVRDIKRPAIGYQYGEWNKWPRFDVRPQLIDRHKLQ